MVLDISMIPNTFKGLFSVTKFVRDNRNCGLGINGSTYEYISRVTSKTDTNNSVKDLLPR